MQRVSRGMRRHAKPKSIEIGHHRIVGRATHLVIGDDLGVGDASKSQRGRHDKSGAILAGVAMNQNGFVRIHEMLEKNLKRFLAAIEQVSEKAIW